MPLIVGNLRAAAQQLIRALRAAREAGGITSRDLSEQLGYSHAWLSHRETGRKIPTMDDVVLLVDAMGIGGDERETILTYAREANAPNPLALVPGIPPALVDATACERTVCAIQEWAPVIVPDLVQTPAYAAALASSQGCDPVEVDTRSLIQIGRHWVRSVCGGDVLGQLVEPAGMTSAERARPYAMMAPMTEPEVRSENPIYDSWPDDIAYYPGSAGEIGMWAGEAIVSGVLGNAVYDGIKLAVRRLRPGSDECVALEELAYALVSNRCRQVDLPCPPLRDFKLRQEPDGSMLMCAGDLEALLVLGAEGGGIEVTLRMTAPDNSGTTTAD